MESGCKGYHVDDGKAAKLALCKLSRKENDSKESNRILGSSTDFGKDLLNTAKYKSGASIFVDPERPETFRRLSNLLDKFEDIFVDKGFAIVSNDELPKFQLKPGWENLIPKKFY